MNYISSVYFVNRPAHVSGIFVAHHQEVHCIYTTFGTCCVCVCVCVYIYIYIYIYTTIGTCCAFQLTVCWPADRQSTKKQNTYLLLYIYSIPPDDGLQIRPKHVEVDWRNKLRINNASSWFLLHSYIAMHGQQNVKKNSTGT